MTNNYTRAYTEVLEILNHFSNEEYSKIPIEKIEFYKNNMDKDYKFKIDPRIELSKQTISNEANAVLISLYKDYFTTKKQKEKLKGILQKNQKQLDKMKREKYNPNNLFKHREEPNFKNSTNNELSLIKYQENSIFIKIGKCIKKIFVYRKNKK